jgi:hypothetical protein
VRSIARSAALGFQSDSPGGTASFSGIELILEKEFHSDQRIRLLQGIINL